MSCVWLERSGSGLVAELAEGERLRLPQSIVDASIPLSTAHASSDISERSKLQLSAASMRAWNSFRQCPNASHDVEALVLVQEAASYLGDEGTLQELRGLLAANVAVGIQRALEDARGSQRTRSLTGGVRISEGLSLKLQPHLLSRAKLVQVLGSLPADDAVLVLRAALAELRPFGPQAAFQNSCFFACKDSSIHTKAMVAALSLLPEHLQPLVLRAADPAVDSARSLTLSHAAIGATARIMRAAASGTAPRIDAVAWQEMTFAEVPDAVWEKRGPDAAAAYALEALQPLTSMASLVELSLTADSHHRGCPCSVLRDGLSAALCSVLPALPKLTRLCLHNQPSRYGGSAGHLSALSTLSALRHLDVSGSCIGPVGKGGSLVRVFAAALTGLAELTHLGLSHTGIGPSGWAVVRDALCTSGMRLRSLDLHGFGGNRLFQLLPDESALPPLSPQPGGGRESSSRPACAAAAALLGLQSLRLSQNGVSEAEVCAVLAQLTCLTCMHMPTVWAQDGVQAYATRLLAAQQHSGVSRLQELSWTLPYKPGSAPGLCCVLGRWSALRTLSLQLSTLDRSADAPAGVTAPLPPLPRLQSLSLRTVTPADVAPLSAALGACSGLTSLTLAWDGQHAAAYDAIGDAIAALLPCVPRLRSLYLSDASNARCKPLADALVRGLRPLTLLTSLTLYHLPLSSTGQERLAQAQAGMPAVRHVTGR